MRKNLTRSRRSSVGGQVCIVHSGNVKSGPPRFNCLETITDSTHPGPPYKTGGSLDIAKTKFKIGYSEGVRGFHKQNASLYYSGQCYLNPSNPNGVQPPPAINLNGWGAKGYNRALPVHDELNLGQFIGEMKDIPGMISSTKKFFSQFSSHAWSGKSAKFWSEAHLNYQFGWAPFLSDLRSIFDMQSRLAKRIDWMKKHSGKDIRRHFTLKESATNRIIGKSASFSTMGPAMHSSLYYGQGWVESWERISERIWFAGCFTFHYPTDQFWGNDLRLKTKLLGLTPDLSLVYKLTPWSWLLDWFTSTGAIIENQALMSRYSQVARFAYVMRTSELRYDNYAFQYLKTGDLSVTSPTVTLVQATSSTIYSRKQRAAANPYGFGATWDGLNPFQLSILAALGITRVK